MLVHRTPFFYGWVVLGSIMLSGSLLTGITTWGISIFIVPMEEELGWSRTLLYGALFMGAAVSFIFGPLIGPWGDTKHGPRLLYLTGAVLCGSGVMLMSRVETPLQYYLVFGGMVGVARYFIQVAHNVIPKWFVRKRGPAMAWASAGSGVGPLIFPYPIQFLISNLGWRDAWLVLGILALVLLVLASLLIHTSPEDVGLHPDGDTPPSDDAAKVTGVRTVASQEYSYTRREALRSQLFWLVLIGVTLGTLGMNGFNPTIIPFLHDKGFSPEVATASVSAYASVAILMRFGWGFMITRMTARHAFMLQCSIAGLAVLFLYFVVNAPMLILAMMLVGFGFGGFWVLQGVMIADYFGRRHIAGVRGIIQPPQTVAGSGGPLLFGLIFDLTGTYAWVFGTVIGAWALSVVATYFARPRPRKAPVTATDVQPA